MDPVLQRLGDVTIQRLEKPKDVKTGPPSGGEPVVKEKEEERVQNEPKEEEIQNLKRYAEIAGPSQLKRPKMDRDITLTRKISDEMGAYSFSDENELSDYESESEIDSEGEMGMRNLNMVNMSNMGNLTAMGSMSSMGGIPSLEKEIKEEEEEHEDDEEESGADFLEQLVQQPFGDEEKSSEKTMVEVKVEKDDDYEYDIKEKLKEMGEISFETVKKGDKVKKVESTENEVVLTATKKTGEEETVSLPKGGVPMRRNIREVMDETKLDESTLAAQRQEMERLRRVQEQQKMIRELQRQVHQERVISLLQGSSGSKPGTSGTRIGSTVLVKLPNGQTKPMTKLSKRPFELLRVPKGAVPFHKNPRSLIALNKKPPGANLTPSVSIAPVGKRPPLSVMRPPSDSDSENEEFLMRKPLSRPKSKDAPVTATIDISSDDDCIVVSETENDPVNDEEPDEDPSNSGMHTNDDFNQPDEQGRVVINIGHGDVEAAIYVAPQIARIMKPHQIGGVRFLFDNVVESTSRFETSSGFGCILAHSMGLGKTLQVVCFSDIFLRHTSARTILCIMPINTLQNWLAEYNMWLPTEEAVAHSPLLAHGEVRPRNFNLHVLNDSHKTLAARAKVIREWTSGGGVLLIGYEQFRLLSLRKHPKSRKKPNPVEPPDDDKNKLLFDEVHEALVKPGPDLVICDEGHRIKNSHASISQALKQMKTKRRVVLTGYPLQNNLMEYWCMVDFVRPNYLGTKTEFCNMFERPIQNGQCIDSTESDIKLMRYRAHVLHSLLVGFVQRRSHTVLQTALPQKEEYVLLVRMTPFQRTLYETFMNEVVRSQTVPNPLKAFAVCCKIWNHPDVLYYFLKKQAKGEAVDIDLEEVSNSTSASETTAAKPKRGSSKKNAAKGKNDGKPAASVTPYNSTSETATTTTTTPKKSSKKKNQQPTPPNLNSNNSNSNHPPTSAASTPSGNVPSNFENQFQEQRGPLFNQNDSKASFPANAGFPAPSQHFSKAPGPQQQSGNFAQPPNAATFMENTSGSNFSQHFQPNNSEPHPSNQGDNAASQNFPHQNFPPQNNPGTNFNQGQNFNQNNSNFNQNFPQNNQSFPQNPPHNNQGLPPTGFTPNNKQFSPPGGQNAKHPQNNQSATQNPPENAQGFSQGGHSTFAQNQPHQHGNFPQNNQEIHGPNFPDQFQQNNSFPPNGQGPPAPYPPNSQTPSFPQNPHAPTTPYPQNPQTPSTFPQNPQTPSTFPQNPQTPSTFPQNPQAPNAFPQNPQTPSPFPQNPQTPGASYPQNPQTPGTPYPQNAPTPNYEANFSPHSQNANFPPTPQTPLNYPSTPSTPNYPPNSQTPNYPPNSQTPTGFSASGQVNANLQNPNARFSPNPQNHGSHPPNFQTSSGFSAHASNANHFQQGAQNPSSSFATNPQSAATFPGNSQNQGGFPASAQNSGSSSAAAQNPANYTGNPVGNFSQNPGNVGPQGAGNTTQNPPPPGHFPSGSNQSANSQNSGHFAANSQNARPNPQAPENFNPNAGFAQSNFNANPQMGGNFNAGQPPSNNNNFGGGSRDSGAFGPNAQSSANYSSNSGGFGQNSEFHPSQNRDVFQNQPPAPQNQRNFESNPQNQRNFESNPQNGDNFGADNQNHDLLLLTSQNQPSTPGNYRPHFSRSENPNFTPSTDNPNFFSENSENPDIFSLDSQNFEFPHNAESARRFRPSNESFPHNSNPQSNRGDFPPAQNSHSATSNFYPQNQENYPQSAAVGFIENPQRQSGFSSDNQQQQNPMNFAKNNPNAAHFDNVTNPDNFLVNTQNERTFEAPQTPVNFSNNQSQSRAGFDASLQNSNFSMTASEGNFQSNVQNLSTFTSNSQNNQKLTTNSQHFPPNSQNPQGFSQNSQTFPPNTQNPQNFPSNAQNSPNLPPSSGATNLPPSHTTNFTSNSQSSSNFQGSTNYPPPPQNVLSFPATSQSLPAGSSQNASGFLGNSKNARRSSLTSQNSSVISMDTDCSVDFPSNVPNAPEFNQNPHSSGNFGSYSPQNSGHFTNLDTFCQNTSGGKFTPSPKAPNAQNPIEHPSPTHVNERNTQTSGSQQTMCNFPSVPQNIQERGGVTPGHDNYRSSGSSIPTSFAQNIPQNTFSQSSQNMSGFSNNLHTVNDNFSSNPQNLIGGGGHPQNFMSGSSQAASGSGFNATTPNSSSGNFPPNNTQNPNSGNYVPNSQPASTSQNTGSFLTSQNPSGNNFTGNSQNLHGGNFMPGPPPNPNISNFPQNSQNNSNFPPNPTNPPGGGFSQNPNSQNNSTSMGNFLPGSSQNPNPQNAPGGNFLTSSSQNSSASNFPQNPQNTTGGNVFPVSSQNMNANNFPANAQNVPGGNFMPNAAQNPNPQSTSGTNFIPSSQQNANPQNTSFLPNAAPPTSQNSGASLLGGSFPNNQQNFPFNSQQNPVPNNQSQNFGNTPPQQQNQGQWGQQDYKPPAEFFNNFKQPYNPNTQSFIGTQWIKKEDSKSGLIFKSENSNSSSSDVKPKINIISDIKLSAPFDPAAIKTSSDKKINIISDIKLEPKKEDPEEKFEFKPNDFRGELKQEIKPDGSKEFNKDFRSEVNKDLRPEISKDFKTDQKPSETINLDEDIKIVESNLSKTNIKEDTGIPYDWAIELLKDYVPGIIENSAKMQILFCIIKESIAIGDRLLVFSQSLITLDLIEQFLQMNVVPGEEIQKWAKNMNYFRLDGSTSALEREKLINEFNSNSKIYLFLVSTRAGSLGINLIGANRVVVLDASWNPCHDTQAVCRVYRYGQKKPCYVYRLVVDKCLEKKIYDRQINKQGMSDRVVDECNPDAHLTMKDVSTLCWDDGKEEEERDWSFMKDNYSDPVLRQVLDLHGKSLNKEPFQHESLLVDRKDKQLSQQEKRLAKKGYEREKQASRQPTYAVAPSRGHRPVASVRPMQQAGERPTRWIPAEHWQRQGMTAQEMTLPLDVVIPTNQPEKGSIVLKAGQKVLVLKSPKGVYMQLESGKIVAIKTAIKVRGKAEDDASKVKATNIPPAIKNNSAISVLPQKRAVKPFAPGITKLNMRSIKQPVPNLVSRIQSVTKKLGVSKTKPYQIGTEIARAVNQSKAETELHQLSSDDEHRMEIAFSRPPPESLLISNQRRGDKGVLPNRELLRAEVAPQSSKNYRQKRIETAQSSALEQLEQSTSSMITDTKQPFQDSLDSITSTYQDDENLNESSRASTHSQNSNQTTHIISDHELEDEPQYQGTEPAPADSSTISSSEHTKSDIPPPDYGYNYYGYNHMQPYPPPPPQGYPGYPPQPPPPYDMYQQPQYNYGMYPPPPPPQGYPPQYPPHPPQVPYDYGAHPPPPQPMYPAYPPYHQQYPPPPGMYPPPAGAPPHNPPYPDYQYNPPPPPQHGPPPPAPPYYPNQ